MDATEPGERSNEATAAPSMRARYWTGYMTVVRKEVRRFMRIWPQTLLPPAITTSLYFLIFGALIGERIGPMNGYPYMEFIVPGLILLAVITNAYTNVSTSFYSTKFQRHIEELLVSPLPDWLIVAGYVTGGAARGVAVALVVTCVALVFAQPDVQHPLLMAIVVVMTATLFALAGFLNALFARSFDDISIMPTFVLTPLTYLGGVFYSVELLPQPWQTLSYANPILYMVNAVRFAVLGVSDIPVESALALIVVFIVVFAWLSVHLMRRGFGIKT